MAQKRRHPQTVRRQQLANASRFLWHFRIRWQSRFSHEHWWLKGNLGYPEQAAWEVLRRHPRVESLIDEPNSRQSPLDEFLAGRALQSWNQLEEADQRHWLACLQYLPPQRGIIGTTLVAVIRRPGATDEDCGIVIDPKSPECKKALRQWNKEGSREVFDMLRRGWVLFAFDPSKSGTERIVREKLRGLLRRLPLPPKNAGRAHYSKWLAVITKFERAYRAGVKGKNRDNLFHRYRKFIGAWTWPY